MKRSGRKDVVSRIQACLTELKPLEKFEEFDEPLVTRVMDPPSYIADIVLGGVGGFPVWTRQDKSRWQVQVTFRGAKFQIRDWKGSTVSVDGQANTAELKELANKLVRKLRSAGRILDEDVQKHAKNLVKTGSFYLYNTYPKARRLYEQFREDLVRSIAELDAHLQAGIPPHKVEHPPGVIAVEDKVTSAYFTGAMQLESKIANCGLAAIAFYFTQLEVLIDIMYALTEKSPAEFVAFRKLSLDERFKRVFPVSSNKELRKIYDALRSLWRKTRNVVVHGYSSDDGILVPLGRFGLVPITYKSLLEAPHYEMFAIDPDSAKSALDSFARMDEWLKSTEPYNFYCRFAETSFEIPFQKERVTELKRQMTTMEKLEEYLIARSNYIDHRQDHYP